MKRKLLGAICLCSLMASVDAQTTIQLSEGLKVSKNQSGFSANAFIKKPFSDKSDVHSFGNNGFEAQNYGTVSAKSTAIEPFASITPKQWGQLNNFESSSVQLYQLDYTFGTNANINIKFLDQDINTTKQFAFDIPSTTNAFAIQDTISNFDFNGNTKKKIMVFLHYFEGGVGPNYQKNAVWVVDEEGTILHKFNDSTAAMLLKNEDGSASVVTYYNGDENTYVRKFDTSTLTQQSQIQLASNLLNYYAGVPISIITIDGETKIVMAHYEKIFMDNATLELTPDNHLLLDIYDLDFQLEKSVALSLPETSEGSYVFGMAEFGMFYKNNKYDITQTVFNTDSQNEYLYSIYFYDMINDKSWRNYFVSDEQGNILKSLEDSVISYSDMNEISGQEDQISFILGDGEAGSAIKMFNIPSWSTAYEFPAVYNGDLLSVYFNRIPSGDQYQYLIGLGNALQEENTYYGVINKYSKDGVFAEKVKLNLGAAPLSFTPLLYADTLNPHTYNQDDDYEYGYVYSFRYTGNSTIYSSFNVAKNTAEPILTIKGDATKGNISSSGFLYNEENQPYLLYMNYYKTGNNDLTEFYTVPVEETLGSGSSSLSLVKIYTDVPEQIIGFTEKVQNYRVYNVVGNLISKGNFADKISTSGWLKGVYIVQFTLKNGSVQSKKVVVR